MTIDSKKRAQHARGSCGPGADGVMHYECPGQNYTINEATCDARQTSGRFKKCRRCTMRIGGKNDPR